jgi:CIC family chloride channel protein
MLFPLRDRRWAGDSRRVLITLAVVVGAGAGLGAVVFRWLISGATQLFTGTPDYSGTTGHPANPWVPWLGPWFVVLVPVVGGLIYGPLVTRFAPEARGHGVPEVMYAVSQRGGRIAGRVAVVKSVASAVCIGSGGSVGREGPIVQIGSALGSRVARTAGLPESRMRTLVACGAAGGIAATFNAPIAGVIFALELLLGNFAAEAFGVIVLSAVVASVTGRAFLGDTPFLSLPTFTLVSPVEYLLYTVLGVLAGLVGVAFIRAMYTTEDVVDRFWRWPEWARPAVGGFGLGVILLILPQLYGVGYPVIQRGVGGEYVLWFLLVLVIGKMLATSVTIGIGGSGGVFAPSLFMGAMLGSAFGQVAHGALPGLTGSAGAYALVGMGAVFAGATRAPITAVIIMFELTGEYTIILPLMLAIAVSTAMSHRFSRDTIYTLKLHRRGVDLSVPAGDARLRTTTVSEVMIPVPDALSDRTSLPEAAGELLSSGQSVLPVLSGGDLRGVVSARAVSEALAEDGQAPALTVGDLADRPVAVSADTTLAAALESLVASDATGVPVVDGDERLVGWLTHRAVLAAVAPGRAASGSEPSAAS